MKVQETSIQSKWSKEAGELEIKLSANQFQLNRMKQYRFFLESTAHLAQGAVKEEAEEVVRLSYQIPAGYQSIREAVENKEILERLHLFQKLQFLKEAVDQPMKPFIHPDNLFVSGESVLLGHRGMTDSVVPFSLMKEDLLKQYKALAVFILQPKLNFEELIDSLTTVKNAFAETLFKAETFDEVDHLISEQVRIQEEKRQKEKLFVSKRNYQLFKWGSLGLAIVTVAMGIATGIYAFYVVPKQYKIIQAETSYIAKDYTAVVEGLKSEAPNSLPKGVQYTLAASSLELDNLTQEQKEAVSRNLSQKSSENTLSYWIYIGRGELEKALDIAQNIGDIQYILHAYTKLYDQVNTDSTMSGAKKRELLEKYQKEIDKLQEQLNGSSKANSTSKETKNGN